MSRTKRESFVVEAVVLAALSAGAGVACGQQYDVTADWSDKANPNGVWSYRAGGADLPHVDDWQSSGFSSDQPGWATGEETGEAFIPFWFRSIGAELFVHDWIAGDVVVHTTDAGNGGANGPATLRWTSPVRGVVTIDGAVWMGRDIGRGNDWFVLHNGVTLTYGTIFDGDAYGRANPFDLANGIGGPGAVTDRAVERGDAMALRLVRTSVSGDFVGVRFTVNVCVGLRSEPGDAQSCATLGNAIFTVEAEGQGELSYQWRYNGKPISVKSNPTAATDTLVIPFELETQGEYDCVVTSACGEITSGVGRLLICAADFTCDDVTNSTDVGEFINQWFVDQVEGTLVTDIDHNGIVNSTDVGEFINRWFVDIVNGCG